MTDLARIAERIDRGELGTLEGLKLAQAMVKSEVAGRKRQEPCHACGTSDDPYSFCTAHDWRRA